MPDSVYCLNYITFRAFFQLKMKIFFTNSSDSGATLPARRIGAAVIIGFLNSPRKPPCRGKQCGTAEGCQDYFPAFEFQSSTTLMRSFRAASSRGLYVS